LIFTLSDGAKLPLARKRHTNQCFNGWNLKNNDGKIDRKNFSVYFSIGFPKKIFVSPNYILQPTEIRLFLGTTNYNP